MKNQKKTNPLLIKNSKFITTKIKKTLITMEEKQQRIAAARAKLKSKMGGGSRMGGRGTMRRKRKVKSKSGNTDSKLNTMFKRFGAEEIPEIAEVNMFTEDDRVLSFKNPQGKPSLLFSRSAALPFSPF